MSDQLRRAVSCHALRAGTLTIVTAAIVAAQAALAQDTQLLWGDLHLHTNYSTDAYSTGNRSVTPDMAYRYARGIPIVQAGTGVKIEIERPLDFLAVTDHAINMGLDPLIARADRLLTSTPGGRALLELAEGPNWRGAMGGMRGPEAASISGDVHAEAVRSGVWREEIEAAEANYLPGEFTTFVAWEWTAMGDGGRNLHRCVISDADAISGNRFIPLSNADTQRPEELYSFLRETRDRTGVDFIAIPHNSNISGGLMFDVVDSDGRPIDAAYARERATWEGLMEITQTKGTSEVHPELSPTDEFAEFEIRRKLLAGAPTPADPADYARTALLRGISFQGSVGANPYKYGFVGATDNHTGTTTVDESNFLGKLTADARVADRYQPDPRPIFPAWEMSASGLTGVWATENTREAIFAALKRKEVYATSGTRIQLRVFGGFQFRADDADSDADIATIGYARGVPMGSDLTNAPRGEAPGLLIHAVMDPMSGNLDRIQVIKGWVDDDGASHERVFDVAWSGDREVGSDGRLAPVGDTVDRETALYENTIGAPQLSAVWEDPEFDPDQLAFYYVRVLEIPTPRHSLYDAVALGIPFAETEHPATIQERAYSSPIWYTP
ncbi:MAG: DUF3604 domain-containing protein [Gammaproteobacteria bacterium]